MQLVSEINGQAVCEKVLAADPRIMYSGYITSDGTRVGEAEQEVGSYKLTKLGANKTKLDMEFTMTYGPGRNVPSKKDQIEGSNKFWDKLIVALMKDYSK